MWVDECIYKSTSWSQVRGKICQEDPRRVRKLRGAHLTHGPNRQIYPNLIVVIHPSCLHCCYSKSNLASSCHVHAFKDAALSDMSQNQLELSLSKVSPATCKRHLPMICPAERPSRPQLLTDVLIILLYHASCYQWLMPPHSHILVLQSFVHYHARCMSWNTCPLSMPTEMPRRSQSVSSDSDAHSKVTVLTPIHLAMSECHRNVMRSKPSWNMECWHILVVKTKKTETPLPWQEASVAPKPFASV